jgi:hypothetical protein
LINDCTTTSFAQQMMKHMAVRHHLELTMPTLLSASTSSSIGGIREKLSVRTECFDIDNSPSQHQVFDPTLINNSKLKKIGGEELACCQPSSTPCPAFTFTRKDQLVSSKQNSEENITW